MAKRVKVRSAAAGLLGGWLVAGAAFTLWSSLQNTFSPERATAYVLTGVIPLIATALSYVFGEGAKTRRSVSRSQLWLLVAINGIYLVLALALPWIIAVTPPPAGTDLSVTQDNPFVVADTRLDGRWVLLAAFMGFAVAANNWLFGKSKEQ